MNNRKLTTVISLTVFISFLIANIISFSIILILFMTGKMGDFRLASVFMMVLIFLCSTAVGMAAAIPLARYFLHPMEELRAAMEKVIDGDYDVTVPIPKRGVGDTSTVGKLLSSFNRMTAELRNTEIFRNDFIANFSHECKTPIFSIKGLARQLYLEEVPKEQHDDFLKIIYEESSRLADLSNEVLTLTKLEKQEIVSDRVPYSLDEQLRRCMLLYEETWTEKELDVEMELEPISFRSNAELMTHVWNNLFGNAVKFTPNNGCITVTAKKNDNTITVSVQDTGIGMDEQTQQYIFDKFYQGDRSHTTPGNGLGLPLVKRVLDLVGGTIAVTSSPGNGSVFTVTLHNEQ